MSHQIRRKKGAKGAGERQAAQVQWDPRITGLVCLLLAAVVWVVFGQTLRHEFINYDDNQYVYDNPRILNGLSLEGIGWAFTHVHADNWHPLTTISHMLDCQLYGLQPWGHHLTNVLLHSAAAIFLFLALRELTCAQWPSAFVAALFAIHPLRVSSVAWISERKDVLSGVFFMLILWAYARYARSSKASSSRYLTVIGLFALGLMCKPTLVTLPFVLLLLDYWPLRRVPGKSLQDLVIEKIPLFVLSVLSCVATVLAQEKTVMTIHQLTFGDRVANAMVSYVYYIGQMIWPVRLSVFYPYPQGSLTMAKVIIACLSLVIVSLGFLFWRRRFLWVGWLWFLGMLVPMIGIMQVGEQARADRYTYLPHIGLYLLITWGAMELVSKWRGGRQVVIALAVLVITGLTADSYVQTLAWRNSETLWTQALAHTSNNYIAHNGLGDALMKGGLLVEAVDHFQKALQIYPDCAEARGNLGNVSLRMGNWSEAIDSFQATLRLRPGYPNAHNNLGICLAEVGRTDEAIMEFNEALRIDRDFRDAHCNVATLLSRLGRREEAAVHLREALRLKPDDDKVRAQLQQLGVEK